MTPSYWQQACAELSSADPVMGKIIASYPGELLRSRADAFYTLTRSIVGQQVSVKAADSIWARCEVALAEITPKAALKADEASMRSCGLSRQKILYLGEIARFFIENNVDEDYFASKTDEAVLKALISIKGVGRWTAEMFLMFYLLRPNVLPIDDIGLQNAMIRHYHMENSDKKKFFAEITAHAARWQPWRSVATWYLWRSLDPVPVAY